MKFELLTEIKTYNYGCEPYGDSCGPCATCLMNCDPNCWPCPPDLRDSVN